MDEALVLARRNAWSNEMRSLCTGEALYLQRCLECASLQYPPRECCSNCLGAQLQWSGIDGGATLLASTELHHSLEPFFAARLPWLVGSLRLDAGPVIWAHLARGDHVAGARLQVSCARDAFGAWCLLAFDAARPGERQALQTRLGIAEENE